MGGGTVEAALGAALVAAALASLAPRVVAALPPPEEPDQPDQPDRAADEATDHATDHAGGEASGEALSAADPLAASLIDPLADPPTPAPAAASSMDGADGARAVSPADASARVQAAAPARPTTFADWPALARSRGLAGWSAAVAALAAGSVALALGPDPSLPAWTALAVVGTWLGWVDWRTRLLPKRLVIPAYLVVGAALLLAGLVSGDRDALVRAVVGWIGTFGVYLLLWLVHPRGLGYGDVRLSGVLGMALGWIGWSALVVGAYAGFLLGAVVGGLLALARIVDRRGYPFGPFMLLGAWLGAVTSPWTVDWF